MATAAALYRLEPGQSRTVEARIPLAGDKNKKSGPDGHTGAVGWSEAMEDTCRLELGDEQIQSLYDAALHTLVLHSPEDVYPGPYTYKRFWFRDAAFILHAMACAGMSRRVRRCIDRFAPRQKANGFFHSQDGEWDSNGEALWIMNRWCELEGCDVPEAWRDSITRAARWIERKRLSGDSGELHAGLLPAGFSAEHLGPNDYYYWDDFWGVTGLKAAARMARDWGDAAAADNYEKEANQFSAAIDRSIAAAGKRIKPTAIPASPYRRMDAGAIGSVVAGYPLELVAADDERLLGTTDFLIANCFHKGGFFQDMIHSGINAYLTLHIAQVLLRAGDPRCHDLMQTVADLASPTGQWPEAIHPRTLGGCMGDGQHVWAAAEWLLYIRNCFVREEKDRLILASAIAPQWMKPGQPLRFGPAPTRFGKISIEIVPGEGDKVKVSWRGQWHGEAPRIEVRMNGRDVETACSELNSPQPATTGAV